MEWHELTSLTRGRPFVVERVRVDTGVAIEGEFEPPQLAQLSLEDQVFVTAFVRCHGSIKEMTVEPDWNPTSPCTSRILVQRPKAGSV